MGKYFANIYQAIINLMQKIDLMQRSLFDAYFIITE
jgi:hypothetical protein